MTLTLEPERRVAGERATVATAPLDEARQRLAADHYELVAKVAARTCAGAPFDERHGFGVEGLVDAAATWDETRGESFKTWAARRIKARIVDAARDGKMSLVRVPRIAARGLAPEVRANLASPTPILRANEDTGKEWELVGDDPTRRPDIDRERLGRALRSLGRREAVAFALYYGYGWTMKEIGRRVGLSESRVSQLMTDGLRRLRGDRRVAEAAGMVEPRPGIAGGDFAAGTFFLGGANVEALKERPAAEGSPPRVESSEKLRVFAEAGPASPVSTARTPEAVEARMIAFRSAVAAKYAPGDRVSVAKAASAAGVSEPTAIRYIERLRGRGDGPDGWPFAGGRYGKATAAASRATGRRVGSLDLGGLDLSAEAAEAARRETPDPTPDAPAEPVKTAAVAPSPVAAPAVSIPMGGDLALMASRLREAADLIERAAAILKGGAA